MGFRPSTVPWKERPSAGYLTDVGTGLGLYTRAQVNNEAPPTLLKAGKAPESIHPMLGVSHLGLGPQIREDP